MRRTKTIRQELVVDAQTFIFDIETEPYRYIWVIWGNETGTAPPTGLILCPTDHRDNTAGPNYPGIAGPPAPGNHAFNSIGPNMQIAFPLPNMLSIGVIGALGSVIDLTVYGELNQADEDHSLTTLVKRS